MNNMLKNNQEGFTLLEVLFSVLILAVGLLGLAAMQITAISGNAYGSRLNTATELIESKMEKMHHTPFDEIKDEAFGPVNTDDELAEAAPGEYERQVEVKNGPVTDSKEITVTVRWTDNTGPKTHEISVSTILVE